jgi:hypothetical protein
MLARICYLAQLLPITTNSVRQINTTISWFIWSGDIFKVPLSTLRTKVECGWGLVNVEAKAKTMYYHRMRTQAHTGGKFPGEWMEYLGVKKRSPNPPAANIGPRQLGYLWDMYTHSAYIEEIGKLESTRGNKS